MANAVVKIPFSAQLGGMGIKLGATATPGTLIHTTGTGAYTAVFDEIWLWIYCSHTADVLTTVEFGSATAPDQNIVDTIPFKRGKVLMVAGLILAGEAGVAKTVKAFAGTTNVCVALGYVLRCTP